MRPARVPTRDMRVARASVVLSSDSLPPEEAKMASRTA